MVVSRNGEKTDTGVICYLFCSFTKLEKLTLFLTLPVQIPDEERKLI